MKLNLELTEKKMGLIPQADKPESSVKKAPWTKGTKFEPKAPKVATHKVNKLDYKDPTKFSKKGQALKTGTVQPGKPEKAPSSKKLDAQPVMSKGKEVKAPPAPKSMKSSAAIPDAMDVKKRGLTDADAGEAVADFNAKVSKVIEPKKSAKNITIAKAKIVKPDLGYGLLKAGSTMDVLGNMKMDMEKVAKPPAPKSYSGKSPIPAKPAVNESVFNGSVEIRAAGRTKLVLEAATPSMVARAALDYASIGARVEIIPVLRGRTLYRDRAFAKSMLESVHMAHHGIDNKEARSLAFRRARDILSKERNPRHQEPSWLRECLLPAFKQAEAEFSVAYKKALQVYDVTVVAENRRIATRAMAADERHAAAIAVDKLLSRDIDAQIKSVFVGGKKFLPEKAGGSLFMKFPKPFAELTSAVFKKKSPMGQSSEPKLGKVPELKIGGSQKPKSVSGLEIKSNTKFDKGGEKTSLVDKNGSKYKLGKVPASGEKPKDSGPVYERRKVVEDASAKVMALMNQAINKATGDDKKKFQELADKVRADEELTETEAAAVDKFIGLALKR